MNETDDIYDQNNVKGWNEGNPLYPIYRNAGPSLALIVPASTMLLVAVFGVVMNSFVIYITLKTRAFRGTANFLMALICVFEVLHQSGHTVFFVVTICGINFISNKTADFLLMPAIVAFNANMMAMFGAAVDRLLAIVFPAWHAKVEVLYKSVYLCVHCFVYALFAVFSAYYVLAFDFTHLEMPTTGVLSEVYPTTGPRSEIGNKFLAFTALLNIACIMCYALIWVHIKKEVSNETNTRLLRSLITILFISVGSYLISLIFYALIFNYGSMIAGSQTCVWQIAMFPGVLLNIGAAANAPILYRNSTEYRKVFKEELKRLAKFLFCRKNKIAPKLVNRRRISPAELNNIKLSIAIDRF